MSSTAWGSRWAAALAVGMLLAAGCGGDDDGEPAPAPASIDEVERCMKDEGLDVLRTPDTLQVALPEDENSILVSYFENEEDARDNEETLKENADELGGEVKRRRTVVYWTSSDGSEEEFRKVEACL